LKAEKTACPLQREEKFLCVPGSQTCA